MEFHVKLRISSTSDFQRRGQNPGVVMFEFSHLQITRKSGDRVKNI